MISLTLPENATAAQLHAARDFFQALAEACAPVVPAQRELALTPRAAATESAVRGLRNVIAEDTFTPEEHADPVNTASLELPAPITAEQAFGGAAVLVPPPPIPAPSFAGADQSATAPAAPSGFVPPVPPAPAQNAAVPVAAPQAPAAPVGSASGAELDSHGLPWDARIHAGSKTKKQDGSWVAKRGINDPGLVARVEAELRGHSRASDNPFGSTAPEVIGGSTVLVGHAGTQAPSTPIPQPPIWAAPPTPPASPATFMELMTRCGPMLAQGKLSQAVLTEAAQSVGLANLPLLSTRPDLVPSCWAYIAERVGGAA